MKKLIVVPAAIAAVGISALLANNAFAGQGSGKSAEHRNDNFVVICHYDRNQQGPNAGPHTITVNANALDHHLLNHVKKEGFIGDDHVGECLEPTLEPTAEPTSTATSTNTPTPEPTATSTPEPTATSTPEPTATNTPEATAEATVEPTETPVDD